LTSRATLAILCPVLRKRLDCENVQERYEGGPLGQSASAAKSDVNSVANGPSHLRMLHFIALAAAGDDAKGFERPTAQKKTNLK
jgi:hypothetical protein